MRITRKIKPLQLKKELNNAIRYWKNPINHVILFLLFLISCGTGPSPEQRAQVITRSKGPIIIGIVRSSNRSDFFLKGATLAVDKINQQGGVIGRKFNIIDRDDKKKVSVAEKIAINLSRKSDVLAVIGHSSSDTAIPSSVIYEKTGILFISYETKSPNLTLYGGNYTFRNLPTQKAFGHSIAEFLKKRKFKRILVFHERKENYKDFTDIFKTEAEALGIHIMAIRSYFTQKLEFRGVIAALLKELSPGTMAASEAEQDFQPDATSNAKNDFGFDSIMISGSMPTAGVLIQQLREMGIGHDIPIMGGDNLDSPELWTLSGKTAEDVYVPTVFNPECPDINVQDFISCFIDKYGFQPDTWAAQGYDAVFLLAHLIKKSKKTNPILLSETLRLLKKWKGVTGSCSFTTKGDIIGKEIFFKKKEKGHFTVEQEDWRKLEDLLIT